MSAVSCVATASLPAILRRQSPALLRSGATVDEEGARIGVGNSIRGGVPRGFVARRGRTKSCVFGLGRPVDAAKVARKGAVVVFCGGRGGPVLDEYSPVKAGLIRQVLSTVFPFFLFFFLLFFDGLASKYPRRKQSNKLTTKLAFSS